MNTFRVLLGALSLLFLNPPFLCSAQTLFNQTFLHDRTAYRALSTSSITATVLSESSPISPDLFGPIGPTPAPSSAFEIGVHPRVVVGQSDWENLLARYADDTHFDVVGSWSRYHRLFTLDKGPNSVFITSLAELASSDLVNLYKGDVNNLSTLSEVELEAIRPLAEQILTIDEAKSSSFFMCALWGSVSRKRAETLGESARFLPADILDTCITATVTWAKIVLAHRAYHCNPTCSGSSAGRANLWYYLRKWEVSNDWYTASSGLGLVYDVLHNDMTPEQRKVIRSAIALLVMKRYSWGNSETSTRNSPNAVLHPHRIFSNWALYHSNLYIANLAIEGETDFDVYTSAVLAAEGESGFNQGLNTRFTAMIEAYLSHSIYPDGSTFEDAYSYFIAFREGSLAVVAAHRRGLATIDTPRFRNFIHNAAQMYEPWRCGQLIGHASGGGISYPSHIGLFRYAYPNGALTNMLWRQRMHPTFLNNNPCRIQWHQTMIQMSFFGGEHGSTAESPQGMNEAEKDLIPKSFYAPRRGLLIARNNLAESSTVLHFDARPDAFFPGHDNADRGIFTFTAFKKTWIGDLPWRENVDSRRHSLMHIDGLAQDEKAPSVRMTKVLDDGEVVLASADLTYAYNVQWARPWPASSPPTTYIVEYNADGTSSKVPTSYTVPETGDPRDFGWPDGDDGADIGFARASANMNGDADIGFMGMYTWKRDYRATPLSWAVRSVALVRSSSGPGYALIADSLQVSGDGGNHVFESYLIFEKNVDVATDGSSCTGNRCQILLTSTDVGEQVDLHVLTRGTSVSFRTEDIDTGYTRLIIKSEGMQGEEFIVGLNAHDGETNGFAMQRLASGQVEVSYQGAIRLFEVSETSHELELSSGPPEPMEAITLPFKTLLQITVSDLNSNRDEYLHASPSAPYQAVFKFTSKTPSKETRGDRINTCSRSMTNTGTEFFVYDCGEADVADERYRKRECELVEESGGGDVCQNFKTDFRRRLSNGRPYFLAVNVRPPAGIGEPKFKLYHSRGGVVGTEI